MIRNKKVLAVATAGVALAVTLTACSSSSKSTSGTTTGSGGGTTTAASGGLAAAQAIADAAVKNPTSIGIVNKLSKVPPTGKYIVIVESPQPVTHVKNLAFAEAAKLFGWRTQTLIEGTGPQDAAKSLTQAVALKPDAILISGSDLNSLRAPLDAATAAKIPVLAETVTNPKSGSVFDVSIDSTPQVQNVAKLMANYVAAKSGGKANALVVNIPLYDVLTSYTKQFQATLASACPSCKSSVLDQQITDLGTKTPAAVVSAIQRNPSINWVIFTIGDLTIGLPAALRAAGLSNKVSIGGETPTQANLAELKTNTTEAWTGFSAPILGYRDADMMARFFNGDPLTPGGDALILPTQIITHDNVGSIVTDSTGYYQGVADFQAQFKALWGLG